MRICGRENDSREGNQFWDKFTRMLWKHREATQISVEESEDSSQSQALELGLEG